MSRLARDGTAEPVSRDQLLRRERGQENIHFPCSADHDQDWQPYPVDPHSFYMCGHIIYIYIIYRTSLTKLIFLIATAVCSPTVCHIFCKNHQIVQAAVATKMCHDCSIKSAPPTMDRVFWSAMMMYGHTYSKTMDQPGNVPSSAENFATFLLQCLPSFLSREEFSCPFPSSTLKSNLCVRVRTN